MKETREEKSVDQWFRISVIAKGALSALEILAGALVFLIPPRAVIGFLMTMSQNALATDPDDFIATHSMSLLSHVPVASQTFIALYLISRGLI